MSLDITPTPHQQAALEYVVDRLCSGTDLIALRGLAGTGKSFLVPHIQAALEAYGVPVRVGSPTHRAAMVLKRKGITDADTIHAHALTPYFTPDFTRAMGWLGEDAPCKLGDLAAHDDINGIPWLVYERIGDDVSARRQVRRHAQFYGAKRALASLGILGRNHFDGFGPKLGEGCLIIDEASMVGDAQLALCQQAFPLICLVGDPGQLPPVKDQARLAEVEGFDLTEIHRQALDSPIRQLAYRARAGESFWHRIPTTAGVLEEWQSVYAETFLASPLIVWRNKTREECTHAIRAELGYPRDEVRIGEPLVCRSTSQEDRADGFYNNALFRIVALSDYDARRVTVQEDCSDKTQDVYVHMEELHGDRIDPKAIPFRFGYCLTAHTAQGGEWPTIYISTPDMFAYAGFAQRSREQDHFARWAYTAITRAKHTLGFLTQHAFERSCLVARPTWGERTAMPDKKPTPPSSPLLNNQPDDIPDPQVPPAVLEPPVPDPTAPPAEEIARMALLNGFCQALQAQVMRGVEEHLKAMMRCLDATWQATTEHAKRLSEQNEHAQYQLSNSLTALQTQGLLVVQNPYRATVHAVSPAGYPITLTLSKRDAGELVEAITALLGWLQSQQFTAAEESSSVSR